MKDKKIFISIFVAILLLFGIYGCTSNNDKSITYTVTFMVDDMVYDTVVVNYDETAVLSKKNPTKEGYLFIDWDKPLTNIKIDTIVFAVWKKNENEVVVNDEIRITVNNTTKANFTAWADGSVGTKIFYLKHGETLIIPAIIYDTYDNNRKNDEDYVFLGWYYKDKNNQEKRIQSKELSLDNLNIVLNEINIYAKVEKVWTEMY